MSTENATPAIALRNVTKTYGAHKAVDELSLTVPRGAVYGFIGPNGSGKTTTLRMILHIIHPDCGSIEALGEKASRAANDRIGYLPEERGLYKKMKVSSLLEYYGSLKGMKPREARGEATRWLKRMELLDWSEKRIESLSKGMAQKVQFIATVLARPELVILDEPYSGLDPVNLESIREAILELRQQGATIVFSTHDMAMAERMCDSIFMIYKGRKVLDGPLSEIKDQYGEDTIRLKVDCGMDAVANLPGVEKVFQVGEFVDVKLSIASNTFLASLVAITRIKHFELVRPTLHDIFLKIAKPKKELEVVHA